MVTKLREAFLAGGAYAKLVHYPKLIDPSTNTEVDGHQLWSKLTSSIMLDVDGYLRKRRLPTWDYNEIKAIAEKNGIKTPSNFIELYLAAPGYKALAQSTSSSSSLIYTYRADTLEHAKERAITACQMRYPGHTCKIIDPREGQAAEAKRVEEQRDAEPTERTKTELTRAASAASQGDNSMRRGPKSWLWRPPGNLVRCWQSHTNHRVRPLLQILPCSRANCRSS
jgi:hypothetical protein